MRLRALVRAVHWLVRLRRATLYRITQWVRDQTAIASRQVGTQPPDEIQRSLIQLCISEARRPCQLPPGSLPVDDFSGDTEDDM